MVRPKPGAVESQGTALEGNASQLAHGWLFLAWIEPGQTPVATVLLRAAQDVDESIHKSVPADLSANGNFTENVSLRVQLQDPEVIPLAEVKILAVKAQV